MANEWAPSFLQGWMARTQETEQKKDKAIERRQKLLDIETDKAELESFKKDRPIRELKRQVAKSSKNIVPELVEQKKAEAQQAVLNLQQDRLDYHSNLLSTAGPGNWKKRAKKLNEQGNYNFTGNWKQDKEAVQAAAHAATQTVEQRQAMEKQRIQLEVAELYSKKVPQIALEARAAYPNDPEMQQQVIQERIDAMTQNYMSQAEGRRTGSPMQFAPSGPSRMEQNVGTQLFETIKGQDERLGQLSQEDQNRLHQNALTRAPVLQEYAEKGVKGVPRAWMDFSNAYEAALSDLTNNYVRRLNEEEKSWWQIGGAGPDYVYQPPKMVGSPAGPSQPPGSPQSSAANYQPTKTITAGNHPYRSANEVLDAIRSGEISKQVGADILKTNFAEEISRFAENQNKNQNSSSRKPKQSSRERDLDRGGMGKY